MFARASVTSAVAPKADIASSVHAMPEGRALIEDTGLIREFCPSVGYTKEARP
jgi:hypothetical protein